MQKRSVLFLVLSTLGFLGVVTHSYGLYLIQVVPGNSFDQLLKNLWLNIWEKDLALYLGLSIATFVSFLSALWLISKSETISKSTKIKTIFGLAAFLLLPGVFCSPYKSIDVFSYAAHGQLSLDDSMGAYTTPAAKVIESDFGKGLANLGWSPVHGPSPYGPVWTLIEMAAVKFGVSPNMSSNILRILSILFFFVSGYFVFLIADRLKPSHSVWISAFYMWNPFFWGELGWEGHNDSIMILCLLASVYYSMNHKWVLSTLLLTVSVLTKYLPVLVIPALFKQLKKYQNSYPSSRVMAYSILSAMAALVVFYAPFGWNLDVFNAVKQSSSGYPFSVQLISGNLARLGFMEMASAFPFLLKFTLLCLVVVGFAKSNDAFSFLEWSGIIFGFYFFWVSPAYWNWYLALPATLLLFQDNLNTKFFLVGATFFAVLGSPLWHLGLRNIIPFQNAAFFHQILCPGLTALLFLFLILVPKISWEWLDKVKKYLFMEKSHQGT